MSTTSPVHHELVRAAAPGAAASFAPWGPAESAVAVAETLGALEAEYAALRKGCLLLDLPQRATLVVRGSDRIDFLHRMITQDIRGMPDSTVRRSFWLSRQGRIEADLRVIRLPDRVLLDCDVHCRDRLLNGLREYVISEDVTIDDATQAHHRFALHGPTAPDALAGVFAGAGQAPGPKELREGHAAPWRFADTPAPRAAATEPAAPHPAPALDSDGVLPSDAAVIADRWDSAGVPGFELLMRAADAPAVLRTLVERGRDDTHDNAPDSAFQVVRRHRLRLGGWHAYNIARIESGTPQYFLDFGPTSLPAETGVLHDRVSFTKGCYLGQEIVARMHALGKPKRVVVALDIERVPSRSDPARPLQPDTASPVFPAPADAPSAPQPEPIGAVTSATLSPMLSQAPIALATIKHQHSAPGTRVLVHVVSDDVSRTVLVPATVRARLAFWPPDPAPSAAPGRAPGNA